MSHEVVTFPSERTRRHQERKRDEELSADAYYRLLKSMWRDAAKCGLLLPQSLEACTQQVYDKSEDNDVISRMLQQEAKHRA